MAMSLYMFNRISRNQYAVCEYHVISRNNNSCYSNQHPAEPTPSALASSLRAVAPCPPKDCLFSATVPPPAATSVIMYRFHYPIGKNITPECLTTHNIKPRIRDQCQ